MDRVHGASESAAFCRRLDLWAAEGAFDVAFERCSGAQGQAGMAGR